MLLEFLFSCSKASDADIANLTDSLCLIRVFYDFSVRLPDRYKVTQHKINFVKNCSQWGLNSQPQDQQSNALPDELSHYLVVGVNH